MLNRILLMTCCLSMGLLGCGDGNGDAKQDTPKTTEKPKEKETDAHPTHGPHKGDLIELGSSHEYHAELVHDDDAGKVTIYILDGKPEKLVPIKATEITINLTHDGEAETFKLAAEPDEGDGDGMSSRFSSTDEHLLEDLEDEDAKKVLVVEIKGKPYRGTIKHHHEGDGHDH